MYPPSNKILNPDIEFVAQPWNVETVTSGSFKTQADNLLAAGLAHHFLSFGEIASASGNSSNHLTPAEAAAVFYQYVSGTCSSTCKIPVGG